MIKITVCDVTGVRQFNKWWSNFVDYHKEKGFDMGTNDDITEILGKYGIINVENSPYLGFNTEEEVTMFLLRWS